MRLQHTPPSLSVSVSRGGSVNIDQTEYWNKFAGPNWVFSQRLLDQTLEPFGRYLLERAELSEGQSVVDVGCGCGDTTIEIARRCGRAWGLDISRPMLALARRRAQESRLPVEFIEADATCYQPGQRSLDRIVSRFGVMFFASPERAFTNMCSWLKPGGKFTAICWQAPVRNPWLTLPASIARRHIDRVELDELGSAPFSLSDAAVVRSLLERAGFKDIALVDYSHPMRICGDLDSAYSFFIDRGPVAASLLAATQRERDQAIAAIEADLAARHDGTGVQLDASSWIIEARA
jgi:ubiquinone/menaquinone biosynthesis C-methylase UbiE